MNKVVTAQSLKDEVLGILGKQFEEAIMDEFNKNFGVTTLEEGLPPYMVEVNFDGDK